MRSVLMAISVVLLLAGGLCVVERAWDFTGYCVGGGAITDGIFDPVDVDGRVVDPLHLAATVDPARATPRVGDEVRLSGASIGEGNVRGTVVALGSAADGEVPFTVTPSPVDGLPTMTPGTTMRVTLQTHAIGKTETISADSLRPPPATVPEPSTVWVVGPGPGGAELGGRAHPVAVIVGYTLHDRATISVVDQTSSLTSRTPGTPVPYVVPDHHCRTRGVWPVVLGSPRRWHYPSDTVDPG